MSKMQLIPRGASWLELIGTKVAGALLMAGRELQSRYVAMAPGQTEEEQWRQAEGWRVGLAAFVTWAAPLNFSRAKVLKAGIVTRPGFEHYMRVLRKMGAVNTYGGSGTIWIGGWDKRKFLVLLNRRLIEAPYPVGIDAPAVLHTRVLESRPAQPARSSQPGTVFAKSAPQGPRLKGE